MATKTATVISEGDGLRFVATVGSGHTIVLDDGNGDTGMRPTELLPVALAACSGMDVIGILRKSKQPVTRYQVHVEGDTIEGAPARFGRFTVVHEVDGDVDEAALRRAIELSATKYCGVGATYSSGIAQLHHRFVLRREDGTEQAAEVIVEGPYDHQAELLAQREASLVGSAG